MNKKPSINFYFLSRITLKQRSILKDFILKIFKTEKTVLKDLNIIFCSDEYLLKLNQKYLSHDYFTDIMSFPLSAPRQPLEAEIYISIDRVRDNAEKLGVKLSEELLRVVFHGVLHFCGYTDKTKANQAVMRSMENKYLRLFYR